MTNNPNLFTDLPIDLTREHLQTILSTSQFQIERIVSHGQASPPDFWYDQETHEWVLLLSGSAGLRIEGQATQELKPGSFLNIPAHLRHRVEWTDANQPTVWLAIHYK